jgi:hypothetical protein
LVVGKKGRLKSLFSMAAAHHANGPHRDTGRFDVDQQEGYAFLRFAFASGAHQTKNPIRPMREGSPSFLSVDDVVIARALGFGLERGQVRARARLRIALAPQLVGGENPRQETLFLKSLFSNLNVSIKQAVKCWRRSEEKRFRTYDLIYLLPFFRAAAVRSVQRVRS